MRSFILLLAFFNISQIKAQVCFASSVIPFSPGYEPNSVVVADFTGDGKTDLAVAIGHYYGNFNNRIAMLYGNGSGGFSTPNYITVVNQPLCMIGKDFNQDGKMDLAMISTNNAISVMLGLGTGSFSAATNFSITSVPFSLISDDFNGDGIWDLATANNASNTISVLQGIGNGNFGPAVNMPGAIHQVKIISSDFNNDSKIDLATADVNPNSVSVYLGSGTGNFGSAITYSLSTVPSSYPTSLSTSDFDSDGDIDIAVTIYDAGVSMLKGNGTGNFTAGGNYLANVIPKVIINDDFNNDGKTDLAVGNSSTDDISILTGYGNGTFNAPVNKLVGDEPLALASSDFNNDGKMDIVCANSFNYNLSIWLNSALPIVTVTSGIDTLCEGDFVQLNAVGASTYTWSTSQNGNTILITPSVTTTYTIIGTDVNACIDTTNYTQIVTDCSVGVHENEIVKLMIYPNPSAGIFMIETFSPNKQLVKIVDTRGKVVYRKDIRDSEHLDVSSLSDGIYYLTINTDKSILNKKIIIIK